MPVILYHGTARAFDGFDARFTLRGSEPNSALGVHLTEDPETAARYAEMAARDPGASTPRVLVVEADVGKAAIVTDPADFMGRPDDLGMDVRDGRTREEFTAARHELEAEGFHAVVLDAEGDGLEGVWVVFDPARLRVTGSVSPEEARRADYGGTSDTAVTTAPRTLFDDRTGDGFEP